MFYYLILFIFCFSMFLLSFVFKEKKSKKIIAIITLIVLCIMSGTRYNLGGADYAYYRSVYNAIPLDNFFAKLGSLSKSYGFEKGFLVYSYFIKLLGFNYFGFTLINSIIFYFAFYNIVKKFDYNMNFIIIMFLYKFFLYNTFVSLRQPLSILIFWYSLKYIKDKQYIKYYLLCILALFFHRSSFILFFIPFIINIKITKNRFLILLLIGLFLFAVVRLNILNITSFISMILSTIFKTDSGALARIESYGLSSGGLSIFYTFEYYLIAIFLYLNYDKVNKYDEYSAIFVKLFIFMLPLFTLFSNFSVVTRFKDYFFLCYPIIIICISKQIKNASAMVYLIAIIISFYGYTRYLVSFDNGCLLPYDSYINDSISIFR